jgi:hypothetical protein
VEKQFECSLFVVHQEVSENKWRYLGGVLVEELEQFAALARMVAYFVEDFAYYHHFAVGWGYLQHLCYKT